MTPLKQSQIPLNISQIFALNPISFIYDIQLSDISVIISFCLMIINRKEKNYKQRKNNKWGFMMYLNSKLVYWVSLAFIMLNPSLLQNSRH